jgi:hypothetical protein
MRHGALAAGRQKSNVFGMPRKHQGLPHPAVVRLTPESDAGQPVTLGRCGFMSPGSQSLAGSDAKYRLRLFH